MIFFVLFPRIINENRLYCLLHALPNGYFSVHVLRKIKFRIGLSVGLKIKKKDTRAGNIVIKTATCVCHATIIIIITAFSTHFAEPQCVYNLKRPYNLSKKLYMFTAIELLKYKSL
jgi:hypothetical protein